MVVKNRKFGLPGQPGEPLRQIVGMFLKRRDVFGGTYAPVQLRCIAVATRLEICLSEARPPEFGEVVEVVVTSVLGTVEVVVPAHWVVVAGRIAAARKIAFEGILDSDACFDDPDAEPDPETGESQHSSLRELIEKRQRATNAAESGAAVVVHVAGLGGSVVVKRSA